MKKNSNFIIREIVGETVLVPTEDTAKEFNGMMTISDTGAFIWEHIEETKDFNHLVNLLLEEYDIDKQTAAADASAFIMQLLQHNMIKPTGIDW